MPIENAISAVNLGKCYQIYDKPRDRLFQFIFRGRKQFFREHWALKDVSFDVKQGESIGIIGRNGSGKSTLLQIICGTLFPTIGDVKTKGRIAALLELGSAFNPDFTGRENVYLNGAVLGLKKEEIDARFESIAAFADIGDFIDQEIKTYSSGMIVRLAFSVSVCVDPDILVVDEALAVGDAAFQFKCLERLKQLTKSGVTMLLVSHDLSIIKNFCDRAIYLQGGKIKSQGIAENVTEHYIMDIHEEQQRQLKSDGEKVVLKPFVGHRNGIAFGTSQGRIVRVGFRQTGIMEAAFEGNENAIIDIEAEFESDLFDPHISIVLQNHKMVELGGRSFRITPCAAQNGISKARLDCNLPIIYGTGRYYLTVKLGSRRSEKVFIWIDKQVGVLTFEVIRKNFEFIGSVDVGLSQINE